MLFWALIGCPLAQRPKGRLLDEGDPSSVIQRPGPQAGGWRAM
jgi:hypothetical protein